jgi:hypothetical protein
MTAYVDNEDECPICYVTYGEQPDGEFITKDGINNSDHISDCKHYFCYPCWKKIYIKTVNERFVGCPLCRADVTCWLKSHYCVYVEEEEDEDEGIGYIQINQRRLYFDYTIFNEEINRQRDNHNQSQDNDENENEVVEQEIRLENEVV